MASQWLIEDRVELRPGDDGGFDELVVYDKHGECTLHAEMMDDKTLWVWIGTDHGPDRAIVMWISAGGKLRVTADEE